MLFEEEISQLGTNFWRQPYIFTVVQIVFSFSFFFLQTKLERQPKKPNPKVDTLGQFLEFDRKILRFYGYWDDRESECGNVHQLIIRYYLADDTIEISETYCPKPGRQASKTFVKRGKLPKMKVSVKQVYRMN